MKCINFHTVINQCIYVGLNVLGMRFDRVLFRGVDFVVLRLIDRPCLLISGLWTEPPQFFPGSVWREYEHRVALPDL